MRCKLNLTALIGCVDDSFLSPLLSACVCVCVCESLSMSCPHQVQCSSPTSFYLSLFWGCGGGDGSLWELAYFSSNLHNQLYLLLRRLMRHRNWCHTCPMLPRCRCKTICFLGCCAHMAEWHCLSMSMTRWLALQSTKLVGRLDWRNCFWTSISSVKYRISLPKASPDASNRSVANTFHILTFKPLGSWTAFFNLSVIVCLDGKHMRCASTLQDETLQKGNILRFYCVILQQMLYKTIPAFRNGADCITIQTLPSPPWGSILCWHRCFRFFSLAFGGKKGIKQNEQSVIKTHGGSDTGCA